MRNQRTEVEKGFIWTVIGYELAGPKIIFEKMIKSDKKKLIYQLSKGN